MNDMKAKRKIGIGELHTMARNMTLHEFESWIAKELYDLPATADASELIAKLSLTQPHE